MNRLRGAYITYVNACVVHAHADMTADTSGGSGSSVPQRNITVFFSHHGRECSRGGVDIVPNDGSLTQGSLSTRVVSSSDTAGTSESTSVDISDLTVNSGDSGAPQAKRLCPHRRQRTGFDTSWYAAHPCLIKRKALH